MDIISVIIITLIVLASLAALVFFNGPVLLQVILEKAQEWEEIMEDFKGDK